MSNLFQLSSRLHRPAREVACVSSSVRFVPSLRFGVNRVGWRFSPGHVPFVWPTRVLFAGKWCVPLGR